MLWLLLGGIALIAFFKGESRVGSNRRADPDSRYGFVSFDALEMLFTLTAAAFVADRSRPAYRLIIAFCFWALLPSMRTLIPAPVAAAPSGAPYSFYALRWHCYEGPRRRRRP